MEHNQETNMTRNWMGSVLSDIHFWVPVAVLMGGLLLLRFIRCFSDRSKMPPDSSSQFQPAIQDASRSKKLQLLGILSGFAAGAWLGAEEGPPQLGCIGLLAVGLSPLI